MSYLVYLLVGVIIGLLCKPLFWRKILRPVFAEWGIVVTPKPDVPAPATEVS